MPSCHESAYCVRLRIEDIVNVRYYNAVIWDPFYASDIVRTLSHTIPTINPFFMDEETEVQRGSVACPRLQT